MSKESRQRLREAKLRSPKKKFRWIIPIVVIVLIVTGIFAWQKYGVRKSPIAIYHSSVFESPTNFLQLLSLNTNDLAKCDIALVNLLCAEGLRGSENLKISNCLAMFDKMAKAVDSNVTKYHHQFQENPENFNNSEGYFKMMMLATVLQQDFRTHYNPAHIQSSMQNLESDESFFANSQDVFINGLAQENGMGTCSSLPVFYVAVGRRLGYPLKLVKAKGHLFARWDEGTKSFNIECTSVGFASHTDDEYRTWPAPFTPEQEQSEGYLKSMTPEQELDVFLSTRGQCLRASGDLKKSLGAMAQSSYREPQSIEYRMLLTRAESEAQQAGIPVRPNFQKGALQNTASALQTQPR